MAIEIRDAVKKYGRGESEICALDHVNLRIEKGEVCVILGPSGSGKSTLLNMIGGWIAWMRERLRWRVWSLQSKTGKN